MEGSGGPPHDKGWALDTVDMEILLFLLSHTDTRKHQEENNESKHPILVYFFFLQCDNPNSLFVDY